MLLQLSSNTFVLNQILIEDIKNDASTSLSIADVAWLHAT